MSVIQRLTPSASPLLREEVSAADAIVAAWLPGTEGRGVTDVLFGDFPPTGKLSFAWPRSMSWMASGYVVLAVYRKPSAEIGVWLSA